MTFLQGFMIMNLRDYLYVKRVSITEFAKKLGLSRGYFNQIVSGSVKPSRRLALHIEMITEGEVKAQELLKGKGE